MQKEQWKLERKKKKKYTSITVPKVKNAWKVKKKFKSFVQLHGQNYLKENNNIKNEAINLRAVPAYEKSLHTAPPWNACSLPLWNLVLIEVNKEEGRRVQTKRLGEESVQGILSFLWYKKVEKALPENRKKVEEIWCTHTQRFW